MSMYSPTQQEFDEQFSQTGLASMGGTPHTTVGAVPVRNQQQRHSGLFNPSTSNSYQLHHHHHHHQRQNSFGAAASIAISPPNNVAAAAAAAAAVAGGRPISFADPNAQNWFGTSLDSNGSSFGQSPIFGGRDLIVSPSTSTGHLDGSTTGGYPGGGAGGGGEDDELQQRNLQEMFEKRRRRRESHNAVERRRRDNINERIHELSTLLPDHLLENAPTTSNVMSVSSSQGGGAASNIKAINKGTILKLSVDHIKELKDTLAQYKDRVVELERLIESAKQNGSGKIKTEDSSSTTTTPRGRHERIGSLQFQQQFGKLHIEDSKQV